MALAISLTALLFSAFVFIHNRRATKRDLFLKVHEQLLATDRQHGRRVVFEMKEHGRTPVDLSPEEFLSANHALASLDMLGYLFTKRYIPRKDATALWGATTLRAYRAAEESGFIALRDTQNGIPIWPYLRQFVTSLETVDRHGTKAAD